MINFCQGSVHQYNFKTAFEKIFCTINLKFSTENCIHGVFSLHLTLENIWIANMLQNINTPRLKKYLPQNLQI